MQSCSRNERHASTSIKAADGRQFARSPIKFYCFKKQAATTNSQRKYLCKLIEIRRFGAIEQNSRYETVSNKHQLEAKLCRQIPLLRMKMLPERSQFSKVFGIPKKLNANQKSHVKAKVAQKSVHFVPRSQVCPPQPLNDLKLTHRIADNKESRLVNHRNI